MWDEVMMYVVVGNMVWEMGNEVRVRGMNVIGEVDFFWFEVGVDSEVGGDIWDVGEGVLYVEGGLLGEFGVINRGRMWDGVEERVDGVCGMVGGWWVNVDRKVEEGEGVGIGCVGKIEIDVG